jgi:hypothetical protein
MFGSFSPRLAPNWLRQVINPWQFFQGAQYGLFNIELGQTQHPETEQAILDEVGSYGRQIGRMGDALEVLLNHLKRSKLTDTEKEVIAVFEGQLAQVRSIKRRMLGHP